MSEGGKSYFWLRRVTVEIGRGEDRVCIPKDVFIYKSNIKLYSTSNYH